MKTPTKPSSTSSKSSLQEQVEAYLPPGVECVSLQGVRLTVRVTAPLSTPMRGSLLLGLEKLLRDKVDRRLEVFLEPTGDVNKLRVKLRGVKL